MCVASWCPQSPLRRQHVMWQLANQERLVELLQQFIWLQFHLLTSRPKLRLGRGLNQSCSSPRELSNGVLHFTYTHWNPVDSRLLVVGSQTDSLTFDLSFDHNLCCRCPNGSCEVILDIYTSRPFQRYKEHFNVRWFDPYNHALNFWESQRTPKSHFR
jgi:hypothetical protein